MVIGLLGYGTVGGGVFKLASARTDMTVKYVLDLREIPELGEKLVHDFQTIVQDAEVDTVVEVLGGLHPSYEFVSAALKAGKNVITANKHLVCHYFTELTELAKQNGVALRCTAAAGGGIPWLYNLERAKRLDKILSVSGIMNGTTNYIMDTMLHNPVSFDSVLKEAQALGYAEANPSADIDGWDIQRKLIISANIAFESLLSEEDVPTFGIRTVTDRDIAAFSSQNRVCKLIATGELTENGVAAYVEPTLVAATEPESAVPSNYNLITFVGENVGRLSFFGQGAGRFPTAYNVVQDCIDVAGGVKAFYSTQMHPITVDNAGAVHPYYVRFAGQDPWLDEIKSGELGEGIVTRPVSAEQMHRWVAGALKIDPTCFIAGIKEGES